MRGILFKPDMIQAIAEGRKTQTRRVIKEFNNPVHPVAEVHQDGGCGWIGWYPGGSGLAEFTKLAYPKKAGIMPRYQPDEVVYIKEAWRINQWDDEGGQFQIQYRLDDAVSEWLCVTDNVMDKYWLPNAYWPEEEWQNPRTMPAWAARYFIKITGVRAERLQEITEGDCIAEGIEDIGAGDLRAMFASLWNSVNKQPYTWGSSPYIFVYSFELQK